MQNACGFLQKKYGRVRKVLEKRNKIRYIKVALHIISYYTIKFDIKLIAYYIDANNTASNFDLAWNEYPLPCIDF
jgi:hypothetical protein